MRDWSNQAIATIEADFQLWMEEDECPATRSKCSLKIAGRRSPAADCRPIA